MEPALVVIVHQLISRIIKLALIVVLLSSHSFIFDLLSLRQPLIV